MRMGGRKVEGALGDGGIGSSIHGRKVLAEVTDSDAMESILR